MLTKLVVFREGFCVPTSGEKIFYYQTTLQSRGRQMRNGKLKSNSKRLL